MNTLETIKLKTLELYGVEELELNRLYDIKSLGLKTIGLTGDRVGIDGFIRKNDYKTEVIIKLPSGEKETLICSPGHLFYVKSNNEDGGDSIKCRELKLGTVLYDGSIIYDIIFYDEKIDLYDVQISSEDMIYQLPNGTFHHNTYTVEKVLAGAGLEDGEGYFKNTGSVSAIGLYMLLYKFRDSILLLDDSDSVWDSQEARNILKAATDTKKIRKLAWTKSSSLIVDPEHIDDDDEESIPKYFNYSGKIIFISNLDIEKLDKDGAMRTRSIVLNMSPTNEEMLEVMGERLMDFELEGNLTLTEAERKEVFEVVKASTNKNALSLRRLVRALNIRAAHDGDGEWQILVKRYA